MSISQTGCEWLVIPQIFIQNIIYMNFCSQGVVSFYRILKSDLRSQNGKNYYYRKETQIVVPVYVQFKK